MLTVEDYGRIRRAHRDGLSIRAIARRLHHSRRKVREALVCWSTDLCAGKFGALEAI